MMGYPRIANISAAMQVVTSFEKSRSTRIQLSKGIQDLISSPLSLVTWVIFTLIP